MYKRQVLRTAEPESLDDVSDGQRANGWLGFDGALPDQLAAVEARLGIVLPPSYRAFLEASDGWLKPGPFMDTMRTTDEIGWVRDVEPELVADLAGEPEEFDEADEIVARSLLISGVGDAQYWLLDPGDVDAEGEWAAYVWASWYPGLGDRMASFAALIDDERASYERLRGAEGHPVHPEGAEDLVAEGRDLALRGDVEAAADAFERAAVKGSGAGVYLGVILSAFLRPHLVHHQIRNRILGHPHVVRAVGSELVRAEAIPLFVQRDFDPSHRRLLASVLTEGEMDGTVPPPVLPEPPEFQAAIDQARGMVRDGRPDDAWRIVVAALPGWRSDSPHRIAPVILLTDAELRRVVTPERGRMIVTTPRASAT